MTEEELKQIAEELVYKYLDRSWTIVYSKKMTSTYGTCNYDRKEIKLSIPLSTYKEKEETVDTILHEIAHALVGKGHHHDDVWKQKAKEIGCSGKRTYGIQPRELRRPSQHRYTYRCPKCGAEIVRRKRINRSVSCGYCSRRYDPEKILELVAEEHYNK